MHEWVKRRRNGVVYWFCERCNATDGLAWKRPRRDELVGILEGISSVRPVTCEEAQIIMVMSS